MTEHGQDQDQDMEAEDWEGGDDMDEEFRTGDCVEVEFDSGDDVPVESDDDGIGDENPNEEIGVIPEGELYSDDEAQPMVDDALASGSHKESVLAVAVNPTDRCSLATGGQDDVAVLWTVEEHSSGPPTLKERCRLEGHTDSVVQLAFSHDGAYVATGSYDGTVKIWAGSSGQLVHSLEGPSKEVEWILWHPKGHAILAGSTDAMAWMWWAPTGKLMQIFAGHAQSVTCGCWGLGGKLICTGSEDRGVIVWNPRAGTPQQHIRQVHESAVIAICAHPEAPMLVTGSEDSGAKVIQMETGKIVANLSGHMDSVESVGFNNPSPGGLLLLATGSMDGKVFIWDGKTFDLRCTLTDHFEHGGIVRARWLPAPHSGWLCTCATDRTVRVFNGLSGACLRTLRGHTDTVLDFDFALGAPAEAAAPQLHIVSGSDDKSFRLFSVALGGEAAGAGSGSSAAAVGATAPPLSLPASGEAGESPTRSPAAARSPGSLPV